MKSGKIFGGNGGDDFDDSLQAMFTPDHYLSGISLSSLDEIDACRFIYRSSRDNHSRIESPVHGAPRTKINSAYQFDLHDDERIEEIHVKSSDVFFVGANDRAIRVRVVRGIQFLTTKARRIPPDIVLTGDDVQSESILGYTLGYATGKSGQRIDQLQFFWYRTKR